MANNTVHNLTKEVLEKEAPYEVYLLEDFDPYEPGKGRTARAPLGFGVESAALLLMPIVYKFFSALVDELAKKLASATFDYIDGLVRDDDSKQLYTNAETEIKTKLLELDMAPEQINKLAATILDVLRSHSQDISKHSER